MPELGHVYMWCSSQIQPVGKTNRQAEEQECLTDLLVALPKTDPQKLKPSKGLDGFVNEAKGKTAFSYVKCEMLEGTNGISQRKQQGHT
jgi:hypothetical protein